MLKWRNLRYTPPAAIRWHFDVADTNVVEACRLAKRRLATRVRCLKDVSRGPLGNAKGFRGEGGHESVIEPEHEGDTTNDLIAIGHPVERADSARCIIELGKISVAPLNPSKKGRGSSPPKANPAFAGNVVFGPSPKATDKTLGVSLSAAAKSSSLLGRPAIAAVNAFASWAGSCFTIASIEVRSGSANKTSNATTAAPLEVNPNNRSRTVVRGHGH